MATIEPEHLRVYESAFDECRKVHMGRFEQHGDHTSKDSFYFILGLGQKCYRVFCDIKCGRPIMRDTLIDLVNYALMELPKE